MGINTHGLSATLGRLALPKGGALPPVRRLLVLVPEGDLPALELARRVWDLAAPAELDVLFVARARPGEAQGETRRRLAELGALTRSGTTHVSTQLSTGRGWPQIVRRLRTPGDLVVVLAGHSVPGAGLWRQPLDQALEAELAAPLYVLPLPGWPASRWRLSERLAAFASLSGGLAVIAAFFVLQVRIVQAAPASLREVLLGLAVLLEFGMFAVFNHFFGGE
jgi:hypothetical protein